MNLGSLKLAGIASRGQTQILQRTFNSSAMVLANQVGGALGIVEAPHGTLSEQWTQALILDIQSSMTRSLIDYAAPGLGRLERALDLRQQSHVFSPQKNHSFSELAIPQLFNSNSSESIPPVVRDVRSSTKRAPEGFSLPVESTAQFLHDWYTQIVPELAREGVKLPELRLVNNKKGKRVIENYASVMEVLEAARLTNPHRIELANRLRAYLFDQIKFNGKSLREAVIESSDVQPLYNLAETPLRPGVQAGLAVEIPYEGQVYRGVHGIDRLANRLVIEKVITPEFAAKIQWLANYAERQGGVIHLKGRMIAVSGLIAEMINAKDLLKTGATVFGIDFNASAVRELAELAPLLGGVLLHSPEPINLLTQAPEIAQTINDVATRRGEKVHMLNLAYAGNVELPLMGAMMAITEGVHRKGNLASVGYLLSTSMPAEISPEMASDAQQAYRNRPRFTPARFFGIKSAIFEFAGRFFGRRVFPPQGPGYLAAQLAKPVDQDHWLGENGVSVSANIAPMTGTASLLVKIKDRAKRGIMRGGLFGSRKVGIYVADVDFTNRLMLFAYLHDILNPQAVGHADNRNSAKPAQLAQQNAFAQAHGRVENNFFGASVRSITSWAFLRHALSPQGWFGRRSIYFSKEGMPFSFAQTAHDIDGAGTWVLPSNASQAEAVLGSLKGPLAKIFGAEDAVASQRLMQSGYIMAGNGVESTAMSLLSWLNRHVPVLGSWLARPRKGLYGSLAMNSLARVMRPEDRLVVEVDRDRNLLSVRTVKPDGEGLGYRLPQNEPGYLSRDSLSLEQVIYLGQPVEGRREVVIPLEFDPRIGQLSSQSSGRIDSRITGQIVHAGEVQLRTDYISVFERIFKISFDQSLTGPIQFSLARAFAEIETNQELGIDPTRVEVREIHFSKTSLPPQADAHYFVSIRPARVAEEVRTEAGSQTTKRLGDMMEAHLTLEGESEGREVSVASAKVRLRVSGNQSYQAERFEEAFVEKLPEENARSVSFRSLSRQDLAEAAAWSDPNPRHQRDILVQAATGRGGVDLPGFLIAAQSEALLRTSPEFANNFVTPKPTRLEVRTLRSVEPGQLFELRVLQDPQSTQRHRFQWIHPKTGKVHVDGLIE